ncbi:hypothetical protein AVEN_248966-1 [Araneus ventricosus]|uniref:Uncharacterized protein n=1 Tax=Araneus ventricosus TaxID=182803 RepID=A0A4Y2J512_ARAVE|nr:hypothetical protein AVEN_248966-1 [Araneus ventricosus]
MAIRVTFLPSLQHLSVATIAIAVYNNPRISFLVDELEELEGTCEEITCYTHRHRVQEKWLIIQDKVVNQLSGYLPFSICKKVAGCLRSIHSEVIKWKFDHYEILSDDVNFKRLLCWKSEGTIDRLLTAKELIRKRSLETKKLFVVACTYFLMSDIIILFKKMSVASLRALYHGTTNLVIRFWIERMIEDSRISWVWNMLDQQYVSSKLRAQFIKQNDNYRIRLSSFFHMLTPIDRRGYFLFNQWSEKLHHDDLRFCFYQMTETEQKEIFCFCPLLVLQTHLEWPLQSVFMNMIDLLGPNLRDLTFGYGAIYILSAKIKQGWKDADYVKILRQYWHRCSDDLKEISKETDLYESLMITLNYNKSYPFPIEQILESYFPFCTFVHEPFV